MTDVLAARVLAAIEMDEALANEHHLGMCTVWTEGWQLQHGPCNCNGPSTTRRRCEADKRTVQRHSQVGHQIPFADYYLDYCASCKHLMPCGDLLDRADAYGVEVETT